VVGPGVHAAQHLAVGVERRADGAERDPVVALERRRLADAEVVAGPREPYAQDLPFTQLAPGRDERGAHDEPHGRDLEPCH